MKRICIAIIALTALARVAAAAETPHVVSATGTNPDRIVRVTEGTRYVNVNRFETVRFVIRNGNGSAASFDHRFDRFERQVFALGEIAPDGISVPRSTEVFINRVLPSD